MYYVYLIKSKHNDEIYVGSTTDLKRRLEEHNDGLSLSTNRYKPWYLVSYEAFLEESSARTRESNLKHHGNAIKELKKRIGLDVSNAEGGDLPSTTFASRKSSAGFTLVELMVSIGIMVMITLIAVSGRAQYDGSLLLTNLAYDISLSIREAQVYGVNVKKSNATITGDQFDASYGVNFSTSPNDRYYLFADLNENRNYDGGDQLVRTYMIKNNNKIAGVCAGAANCSPGSGTLNVTFHRPDPEACLSPGPVTGTATSTKYTLTCTEKTGNKQARITVSSANGLSTRCIKVSSAGHISVSGTCN
jgi:putative endonuclease